VIVQKEPSEAENPKTHERQPQILVLLSQGNPQEDLRQAHASKAAKPGLKVLLVGMGDQNEGVLFYVRGGVNGFVQGDAAAKEMVGAVRALRAERRFAAGRSARRFSGTLSRRRERSLPRRCIATWG
jgi:DNA-binding NarL/FixJ family response regulator